MSGRAGGRAGRRGGRTGRAGGRGEMPVNITMTQAELNAMIAGAVAAYAATQTHGPQGGKSSIPKTL